METGLEGDFLEVSDPYCQGPVPRDGDLVAIRARFIAAAYDLDPAQAQRRLAEAYTRRGLGDTAGPVLQRAGDAQRSIERAQAGLAVNQRRPGRPHAVDEGGDLALE